MSEDSVLILKEIKIFLYLSPPPPTTFSFLFLYWIALPGCFNLLLKRVPVFTCMEKNANINVSENTGDNKMTLKNMVVNPHPSIHRCLLIA